MTGLTANLDRIKPGFPRHWWDVDITPCDGCREPEPTTTAAAVIAADPADPATWSAVLGRLHAAGSGHGVLLGSTSDPDAVTEALLAGAGGWLFQPASPPRAPTPRWRSATAADGRPIRLSAREVDVLQGIADGRSVPQIAQDLGLSVLTVNNHVSRASRRLAARSRGHLLLLALRAGVIR